MNASEPKADWRLMVVLAVAALILAGGVAYLVAVMTLPGDGAFIRLDTSRLRPQLEVVVRVPQPGGLQTGDIVLSLAGRTPDDWLAAVWQTAAAPGAFALEYQVQRGGAVVTVVQPLTRPSGLVLLQDYWAYFLFSLYLLLVALVVVVRRPHSPSAQTWLLISAGLASSFAVFRLRLRPSDLRYGWLVVLYVWSVAPLYIGMGAAALHFALVFPRALPIVRRRPWLVPAIYLAGAGAFAGLLALNWPSAATNAARLHLIYVTATQLTGLGLFLPVVVCLLWVLRHTTDPSDRRQIRWLAMGVVITIVPWVLFRLVPQVLGQPMLLPAVAVDLLFCALPTSLAIAILRERLFDIDVLVNRTLVYGVLSGLLALIYFGMVVVLQAVVGLVSGPANSQLVIVLSTLAVAAAAAPLRSRVQSAIDRRFYRRRYDAGRTLAAFGQAARNIVDLQPLSDQLETVVQNTMEPAHVSLAWVRGSTHAHEAPPTT